MSDAAERFGGARPLRIAGIALAAVLLTAFFMVLDFPYGRLADRLVRNIERDGGIRVDLAEVSPGWVRWGPGLEARDVRIERTDGTRVELSRLAARPALSLSWLSGAPALATEAESPMGRLSGTVTLGPNGRFEGKLRDVDLGQIPAGGAARPRFEGTIDADLDLTLSSGGPEGTLHFAAREGSVVHRALPIALPFEEFRGDIVLGGEHWGRIEKLELRSPLASGSAHGTIGKAPSFEAAPLELEIDLTVNGVLLNSLEAQGLDVSSDGRVRALVTGTPARPRIR